MKTRLVIRIGIGVATAAVVAAASVGFVHAFNPQPDPPGDIYGLITINPGEQLQLNVSNYSLPPEHGYPPGPCRATLTFFDQAGNAVAHKPISLAPGASDSLSFSAAAGIGTNTIDAVGRVSVRAAVYFERGGAGQRGDTCVSGLQLVGASGETSGFINPGVLVGSLTSNHNETLVEDR